MDRHWSDVRYIFLELRYKQSAFVEAQRERTCHSQANQHREEGYITYGESLTLRR
jgi:hypothetical protein